MTNSYKRHRFPAEIISHCVWLYFRLCLSYRDMQELMAERGITLTYKAARSWCQKFGHAYANQLCRQHPRPGDNRHLDEVCLTINGQRHDLWRAVAQDSQVLAILVRWRRDKAAAKTLGRLDPLFQAIDARQRQWGKHHLVAPSHVANKLTRVRYAVLKGRGHMLHIILYDRIRATADSAEST